jgi:hypothetical protein
MTIYIDSETKRRGNIYYTHKGFSRLHTPEIRARAGVVEIAEPTPPEDYSDEFYYRTEQDDAPYVVYTRKSDEQIAEVMLRKFEQALDEHLNSVAQEHRYNDRFTFAIRAGYPGPFQAEGLAFATWMDTCNSQAYQLLTDVQAGTTPMPATPADFIATLPAFVMP